MTTEIVKIRPQDGYQMKALSSSADIVIGGGAAGAGKTYALLLEPLKHILTVENYGAVIFRRTTPQIRNEGALWDTSMALYSKIMDADPKESSLEWNFNCNTTTNKIKFAHLEYEKNKLDWQGSQIPLIGFDELTHFSESMFFYLLSRNRSTCGIKPKVVATCNPDPESWVAKLIEWWIDQNTGFVIPERDGKVRYFIKSGNDYIWGNSFDEVYELSKHFLDEILLQSGLEKENFIKSIAFISGSIYGNKELLKVDPSYLANLMAQDEQTRSQLLDGNWKLVFNENDIYDYASFSGMFDNVLEITGTKRITADIALKGSNKMVIGCWEGRCLIDIDIVPTSDGKKVIERITEMAQRHGVQNKDIAFDADGVGGFVDGFLIGAMPFNGGLPPKEVIDKTSGKYIKENYFNLKTQCFYRSGMNVEKGLYKISPEVAIKMYDNKMTVRQRFMYERKAIKRDKVDMDGKLKIIPKDEMKVKLNGESPDMMDMFMINEIFDLIPQRLRYTA